METKLRLSIVKDWHDDPESLAGNKDGILAAFDILASRHTVKFISRHTDSAVSAWGEDAILCWGSLDRPWHNELPKGVPAFLCFAGGPTHHEFLKNFQHIFVESQVYLDDFSSRGISCSRAFGTNTQIFRSEPRTPRIIPALYPASFCFHKDHELFARALGSRGLAVGYPNELDIVGRCLQYGTPVLSRVSSRALADLYNLSSTTCIPSGPNGGSQRVVLESFACGTPVICSRDNDKCAEFIRESGFGKLVDPIPELFREAVNEFVASPPDPQVGVQYIRNNWTEHHYADSLEKGIRKCLTP